MKRQRVHLGGSTWEVEVLRRCIEPPSAPRLIAVCYNQTGVGVEITRAMIESICRYTPAPHELWIVDNASPPEYSDWLRSVEDVNVVFNHTPPVPPSQMGWRVRLGLQRLQPGAQMDHGSYANGIGLELGAWAIDPNTEQVFVMHDDVLALRDNWLPFLQSKLSGRVRSASILRDAHPDRIKAPHVCGLLLDFTLFESLQLTFMPDLPRLDVGDQAIQTMRDHGYDEYVCRNTYNEPELVEWIPADSLLRRLQVAPAFDDERNIIFAHLGRGTPKATGRYHKAGKTYPEQWLAFAREASAGLEYDTDLQA